jgi:prefoldin subunit 2
MASAETTAAPPSAPPAIQYREIMAECQRYMQKIAELEVDRNEHALVEETLQPLDPSRRAYRLVGDVLVERSVGEVLPSVSTNKENVRS